MMKTKPIIISISIIILLVGIFLFVCCRNSAKPEKAEISQFLNAFNNQLKEGNTDSLLAFFEVDKTPKILKRLVNLLAGKKDIDGKAKPLAGITLDIDASAINILNPDITIAKIPATFKHDSLNNKNSVITLKIHKIAPHQFKIIQVDARQFLTDYAVYENFVRSNTVNEKDLFSPITLAAFKTANQLKIRYDSVIWFAHVDKRTFFYVIKGKWNMDKDINRYKDSIIEPYKMGLVNPDLKEIIPPEYDLVHNISGTFPGLVEVEKENKKGFYNLDGKIVIPVNYDQIFPVDDETNLAVLRNGNDYFYLKKDMIISEKVDLKINDFFSKIRDMGSHLNLYTNALSIITEYNSREANGAVYIPPSYLVDLNIVEKVIDFKNPYRKIDNGEVHENYEIGNSEKVTEANNWLEASFFSIRDYFLGGRSEFYDKKNLVIVDKKKDRVFAKEIGTDYSPDGSESLTGICNVNSMKIINDSLFELKAGAVLYFELYDSTKTVIGGPYYHYLTIKDNKLIELPNYRNFGFTKYIKMDDSYLNGCYNMLIGTGLYDKREKKTLDHVTTEMLDYIKNEIFADYRYQFKDKRWENVFMDMPSYNSYSNGHQNPYNVNVNDSLTEIDKYNINYISQKLKEVKTNSNKLAAK
ncbi:MAG: hypothetical protein JWQ63_1207 [Mucilaginibacter sp.]|nr:hypothetical protein [Mucilaginibacter sp.]